MRSWSDKTWKRLLTLILLSSTLLSTNCGSAQISQARKIPDYLCLMKDGQCFYDQGQSKKKYQFWKKSRDPIFIDSSEMNGMVCMSQAIYSGFVTRFPETSQ